MSSLEALGRGLRHRGKSGKRNNDRVEDKTKKLQEGKGHRWGD